MGSRVASARRAANAGRLRHRPAIRRLHLALLQSAGRQRARGFALPIVILAVLVMSVGSLAIANRSSLGSLGTVYQSLGFDAQEAAEIGMNRIISELNRSENRGLLRSKGSAVESALWTASDASSYHASRCPGTPAPDLATNPSIGYPATDSATTYNTLYIADDGRVSTSSSGASRAYRLLSVTRRPDSELRIFTTMTPPAGTVILVVEGRALNSSGGTAALTTLRREFQLVPKCCGTGFGGAHGNVSYQRPALDSTPYVCLPSSMQGLGLVGGTGSSTGSFALKGSNSITTDSGTPISRVFCLADSAGTCTRSATENQGISIDLINPRPSNFPPAKIYPGTVTTAGTIRKPRWNTASPSELIYCLSSEDLPDEDITDTTNNSKRCRAWAINADAANNKLPSYCTQSSSETHCLISLIDYTNTDVYMLTNSRKLRLYFASSGQVLVGGTGNRGVHHCKSVSFSNGSPTGCATPLPSTADLAFFGCNTCGSQSLELKGTSDVLNMFMYVPNGTVNLAGTTTFQGVLWTNTIQSNGNVNWVIPGSGLRDVMELMGLLAAQGQSPTSNPLLFDYVARATSSFRWLNP
jgi:Tfp pilus assembly protein PilV